MANTRTIVKRRKAVRNIHKITRTMNLIATSKFRKAHDRAVASQPYTEKVTHLVGQLADAAGEDVSHPLLNQREVKNDLLLVVTSNRGLCGGYNAALLRTALDHYRAQRRGQVDVRLEVIGKKGIGYLKFLGYDLAETFTHIDDQPTFAQAEELASRYIDAFTGGEIDSVHVAYTRFVSAGTQMPEVARLLPLGEGALKEAEAEAGTRRRPLADFDFSPEPAELLAELLPVTVKVRLFQFLQDAAVSEQIARMRAMKAATDNAEDMIKALSQQYNRARQSQITNELLDIMGGAEALG